MASLNPNLIMGAVGREVPLNDLGQVFSQAAAFRQHQEASSKLEEENRQRRIINEAYAAATGADGRVDNAKLQAYLAQNSVGAQIPVIQKANSDLAKADIELAAKRADTGKTIQETLYNGLKLVDNTVAALAARPDVNDRMVYGEVARLVGAGAFDVQAQQRNVSPDDYARELLSTMPVGNPTALRNWLISAGARVADATKRLELSLPKYDEQNRGGTLNQGTINQFTGQRTAGTGPEDNITLTPTADATLSSTTQRRGQDLVDQRARQLNEITREAGNSQVVETPQGYMVVNKGTAMGRPVADASGQPALGKDSQVAKDARIADRLGQMIPMVRDMLSKNPTASGSGAAADKVMEYFGMSTKGADIATALETAAGWMTSNVPRFEGPQSDADRATYATMAGLVGDRTKPVAVRLAALDSMERLMRTYSGQRVGSYAGPPGTQPATVVPPRPLLPGGAPLPVPGVASPAGGQPQRPSLDSFYRRP